MKIKYRNTGFMRQVFVYFKHRYCGIEFSSRYLRYYKLTPQGVMPKYKEIAHQPKLRKKN